MGSSTLQVPNASKESTESISLEWNNESTALAVILEG